MLFVSSSCSKCEKIGDAIREFADHGFLNIELSGGTSYYDEIEDDIISLKEKYNLNYLVHNYFPPSSETHVINLASLDDSVYQRSLSHLTKAVKLSKALGADKYGFHAGFFVDIQDAELGNTIKKTKLNDTNQAINRFCEGYDLLAKEEVGISLYIENNVYSQANSKIFGQDNPFMLTTYDDYLELKKHIDFKLQLDVAHLYVSTNTLGINFEEQLELMFLVSDYIHVSNNNGLSDQNKGFIKGSKLLRYISRLNFTGKIVVLEIYNDIQEVKESFNIISDIVNT
jgi:sugar phosphate isomerase/epimerase